MILDHKQLLIIADLDDGPKPNERMFIIHWLMTLIENKLKMKIMDGPYLTYCNMEHNRGWTAITTIETSHIVAHIWDEDQPNRMQLDVYSCQDFNPEDVFDHLQVWKPRLIKYKFIDRNDDFVVLDSGTR